jgi:hypothetical protein
MSKLYHLIPIYAMAEIGIMVLTRKIVFDMIRSIEIVVATNRNSAQSRTEKANL